MSFNEKRRDCDEMHRNAIGDSVQTPANYFLQSFLLWFLAKGRSSNCKHLISQTAMTTFEKELLIIESF